MSVMKREHLSLKCRLLSAHCGGSAPEQTKSLHYSIFTRISTAPFQAESNRLSKGGEWKKKGKYCMEALDVSV